MQSPMGTEVKLNGATKVTTNQPLEEGQHYRLISGPLPGTIETGEQLEVLNEWPEEVDTSTHICEIQYLARYKGAVIRVEDYRNTVPTTVESDAPIEEKIPA